MNEESLRALLEQVHAGRQSVDDALTRLRTLPFEDLGFARVDHHRGLRCAAPEVIFGVGKTPAQVAEIFERRAAAGGNVVVTRTSRDVFETIARAHSAAVYHEAARMITLRQAEKMPHEGTVAVLCAGTSDIPVAEEARITAEMMDQSTAAYYDVGVAGLHRLLAHLEEIRAARVAVVVAGMEGALPSVVGGLVDFPVIAVPTSVGYGASFGGLTALLAMLNSCAAGVTVVNVDNGFGAGYAAALIQRTRTASRR